jgi:pimeloyl-ACP methyl ester carboxylesterase
MAVVRVGFETVNGVPTRLFRHGGGRHGALLLHGVGTSADSWFRNLPALGRDDRLAFAPDLLGMGMTGDGAWTDGPPHGAMVGHLADLIDHLGLERVDVVGSSFGAMIAAHLVWRLGPRARRLILVGASPVLNSAETMARVHGAALANGRAAMDDLTLETCRRRLQNLIFDKDAAPEPVYFMQLTLAALPGARERWERRMRAIGTPEARRRYDVFGRLEDLVLPTLAVWGRHDPRGDFDEAAAAAKRIPNGRWVVLEECGHLPYLEQPDRFNELARAFLDAP